VSYGYFDYQRRIADASDIVDRLTRVAQEHALKIGDTNNEIETRILELSAKDDDVGVSERKGARIIKSCTAERLCESHTLPASGLVVFVVPCACPQKKDTKTCAAAAYVDPSESHAGTMVTGCASAARAIALGSIPVRKNISQTPYRTSPVAQAVKSKSSRLRRHGIRPCAGQGNDEDTAIGGVVACVPDEPEVIAPAKPHVD
jgi:hypothetical protein